MCAAAGFTQPGFEENKARWEKLPKAEKDRILHNYERWRSFSSLKRELIRKRYETFKSLSEEKQGELRRRANGIGTQEIQAEKPKPALARKAVPAASRLKPDEHRKASSHGAAAPASGGKETIPAPQSGKAEKKSRPERWSGSEKPDRPEKIERTPRIEIPERAPRQEHPERPMRRSVGQ